MNNDRMNYRQKEGNKNHFQLNLHELNKESRAAITLWLSRTSFRNDVFIWLTNEWKKKLSSLTGQKWSNFFISILTDFNFALRIATEKVIIKRLGACRLCRKMRLLPNSIAESKKRRKVKAAQIFAEIFSKNSSHFSSICIVQGIVHIVCQHGIHCNYINLHLSMWVLNFACHQAQILVCTTFTARNGVIKNLKNLIWLAVVIVGQTPFRSFKAKASETYWHPCDTGNTVHVARYRNVN